MVGGGIGGLATGLALGKAGHRVTIVERDDTPMPASPDEAFAWDRRGAPQVRHSHAFLARLRNLLVQHHPDVHRELLDIGAFEMRFGENLPPEMEGFEPEPDDAELVMIAARRTTFEWVLRRHVTATGVASVHTGRAVTALTGSSARATGVLLDDGTELGADLVVLASGRRADVQAWISGIDGRPVAEEVEDTGIVYLSRFYRLRRGRDRPPRGGLIGGDLGYLKYGVFVGDNDTFSITLAVPTDDRELRRRLTAPGAFEAAGRQLAAAADWLDGRAEPLDDRVHAMAGLLNRWCDLVVDGEPVAVGVVGVGDAVLCTNPLYGRGCTTAFWSAQLLADSVADHAPDPRAIAVDHAHRMTAQIRPWYTASVRQDAEARRVAAAILAGEDPDGDTSDSRTLVRAVFRDGLRPATRTDPVVLRAFVRNLNLLSPPDALTADADVVARVLSVYEQRAQRPPEPVLGPASRDELVGALT